MDLIYLISSVVAWIIAMEMNSSQDTIWSSLNMTKTQNDKLHSLDAVAVAVLGFVIALGYKGFTIESLLLGLFFFFARAQYFSWRMNMKRKKKGINITWFHLGANWWDNIFKGNEKLYFIVGFAAMPTILFWLFKEYV